MSLSQVQAKDWLEPGAIVIAAAAAILAAILTVNGGVTSQNVKYAFESYDSYLKDAYENPLFGSALIAIPNVGEEYDLKSMYDSGAIGKDFLQYQWFVSRMLGNFEKITEVVPDDPEWKATILHGLMIHAEYLRSPFFSKAEYENYTFKVRRFICIAVGTESCARLK